MSSRLPDTPARLDGLVNFRDTGGTPIASGGHTRAGVLYRSDALANLSPAGREALEASPIGVVVDLRTPTERVASPNILPSTRPIRSVELPIRAGSMLDTLVELGEGPALTPEQVLQATSTLPSPGDLYVMMLESSAADFAEVARLVALPDGDDHPGVLVHCTAGKDRTGVATALILDAVGAERERVVADYATTESNLAGPWADAMFAAVSSYGIPITPALGTLMAKSPREAIEQALAWVDAEFGGAAGYLASGGLTGEDLAALRERLAGPIE